MAIYTIHAAKTNLSKLIALAEVGEEVVLARGKAAVVKIVPVDYGQAAGALPSSHRDPFDRMLVAQAMLEDLTLVSNERVFDAYGVKRLW